MKINNKIIYLYQSKQSCLCLIGCILILVMIVIPTQAGCENKADQSSNIKTRISGPYCGLLCLYLCMKLFEKEIDFRELGGVLLRAAKPLLTVFFRLKTKLSAKYDILYSIYAGGHTLISD